jgi:type II secretory pathway pseudopilin PulG
MHAWELLTALAIFGAAAVIYLTGRRRRQREAEEAARDLEAMRAANEAHRRHMDDLLKDAK